MGCRPPRFSFFFFPFFFLFSMLEGKVSPIAPLGRKPWGALASMGNRNGKTIAPWAPKGRTAEWIFIPNAGYVFLEKEAKTVISRRVLCPTPICPMAGWDLFPPARFFMWDRVFGRERTPSCWAALLPATTARHPAPVISASPCPALFPMKTGGGGPCSGPLPLLCFLAPEKR